MEVLNHKEFRVTDEMLANKGRRLLNFIIDRIIFYLVFALLGIILVILFGLLGYEQGIEWLGNLEDISPGLDYLITFLFYFSYYMVLETLMAKTIGKAITGTLVVMENGTKPTPRAIAIRSISRFVPFDPFSFFGEPTRGWHDSWSNTYVVKEAVFNEQRRLHQQYLELGVDSLGLMAPDSVVTDE